MQGCNWPLVTWSRDSINVHRSGAICPKWYNDLKNSEVWDVLNVNSRTGALIQSYHFCSLR